MAATARPLPWGRVTPESGAESPVPPVVMPPSFDHQQPTEHPCVDRTEYRAEDTELASLISYEGDGHVAPFAECDPTLVVVPYGEAVRFAPRVRYRDHHHVPLVDTQN